MTQAPIAPPAIDEDEALAAELVLGLLNEDEMQAIADRLGEDAGFAQKVRDWQERLATLAGGLTPVMPPARARQRIREKLGHSTPPLTDPPDTGRAGGWGSLLWLSLGLIALAALGMLLWPRA
ncbi:hypothetical protein [Paracoccus sp. (in: a-proteobacteria)]|uniref:hypothetical protein n=1 Tax=Paracoccus sp. TaxID=267 RepID=UPI003A851C5F